MSFIGSIDIGMNSKGMVVLNPNEILMNCSYIDNEKDVYRGLCIVSLQTGEILRKCHDFDFINTQSLMSRDFTMTDNGIVFPLNSLETNTIIFYDVKKTHF